MSPDSEDKAARPMRGRRAYVVLLALVLGLGAGALSASSTDAWHDVALKAAGIIGGLWLNGLKMTVIPLIVALLVPAVASAASAAQSGKVAARAMLWFILVYGFSAIIGAAGMSALVRLFPLNAASAQALQAGLSSIDPSKVPSQPPGVLDFFSGVVPSNVFAAATNGDVLPLVIFVVIFAFAVTRITPARRDLLVGIFQALADALLMVIGWVLWLAPLGVFALGYAVGAAAGAGAFGALLHYVLLVSTLGLVMLLSSYAVAAVAGGLPPRAFAKAEIAPQSLAISTRSSLACLPAMLGAARILGIRERTADLVLPLAVALFRPTGPAMNVGVAFYVAHWFGIEPSVTSMIAAVAVGSVISFGSVSVPGEVSFLASIAPIAMALGVPIAPLALLVAVEMIPDIFRTVGNVTMDVAVTAAVDRSVGERAKS